jgi:hypothetical protein
MNWTEDEMRRLRELSIDPSRHNRDKLFSLVDHFKSRGTIYSVYRKGIPVNASQQFAEKIKKMVGEGRLDWLLSGAVVMEKSTDRVSTNPVAIQRHFDNLMTPLLGLLEVLPLGIHDRDIGIWFIRPNEENWPVTKGRAYRNGDVISELKLDAEEASEPEFELLKQHMPDDPVWKAIEGWKTAMTKDLTARFALLRKVVDHIESLGEDGGLEMPVEEQPERSSRTGTIAGVFLAFIVYDQILTDTMQLRHGFYNRDRVEYLPPDLTQVAGFSIVRTDNENDRQRAIDFFFEDWKGVDWKPEVDALARAYRAAESASDEVKRRVNMLRLGTGFPQGSRCVACQ